MKSDTPSYTKATHLLAYVDDGGDHVCVHAVHVVEKEAAAPVNPDPVDGAGRQAHSRPRLQDGLRNGIILVVLVLRP